jgi:hypothetical protein
LEVDAFGVARTQGVEQSIQLQSPFTRTMTVKTKGTQFMAQTFSDVTDLIIFEATLNMFDFKVVDGAVADIGTANCLKKLMQLERLLVFVCVYYGVEWSNLSHHVHAGLSIANGWTDGSMPQFMQHLLDDQECDVSRLIREAIPKVMSLYALDRFHVVGPKMNFAQ